MPSWTHVFIHVLLCVYAYVCRDDCGNLHSATHENERRVHDFKDPS